MDGRGHAHASFKHGGLAFAQGAVAGADGAAVVAEENDDGLARQLLFLQHGQQPAHLLIHIHHGCVRAAILIRNVRILGDALRGRFQRRVRSIKGDIGEERASAVALANFICPSLCPATPWCSLLRAPTFRSAASHRSHRGGC